MFRNIIFVLIVSVALSACQKPDVYSDIPVITFKSMYSVSDIYAHDSLIYFTIGFTDGDGDIGYYTDDASKNDPIFNDISSIYYNNFVVSAYKKVMGSWVYLDSAKMSGRIPYLTPDGKNKSLRGDIQQSNVPPDGFTYDTARFDIFIYDRSFHQSNTISTPEIILRTYN